MYHKKQYGNIEVWIKNSGEVEFADMAAGKVVHVTEIESALRIGDAQEQLDEECFASAEEIKQKIEAANEIDVKIDKCEKFFLLGFAGKAVMFSLAFSPNEVLLFGFMRDGLETNRHYACLMNKIANKAEYFGFGNEDGSLQMVVDEFVSCATSGDKDKVLQTIRNVCTYQKKGEINPIIKMNPAW